MSLPDDGRSRLSLLKRTAGLAKARGGGLPPGTAQAVLPRPGEDAVREFLERRGMWCAKLRLRMSLEACRALREKPEDGGYVHEQYREGRPPQCHGCLDWV